jgi:MraZ protein
MFRGNHPARVDDRGRLKLPAEYKRGMEESAQFYITSKDGKRAEIYPIREWEVIEAKLAKIPNMDKAKKKFLDVTNYYGQTVELDAQGRLVLPQLLRESARLGVNTDVVVLGSQTYLEVVHHDDFKATIDTDPLNDGDMATLADFGL